MKHLINILFVAIMAITVAGCGLAWSTHYYKNYEMDVVMSARVGEPMIIYEAVRKNDVYQTIGDGLGQELVYGGVANNTLKVMYREFGGPSASFARPAFSMELQYDLAQSKVITYKTFKIEIVECSNEIVRYKVLEAPRFPEGVTFDPQPAF